MRALPWHFISKGLDHYSCQQSRSFSPPLTMMMRKTCCWERTGRLCNLFRSVSFLCFFCPVLLLMRQNFPEVMLCCWSYTVHPVLWDTVKSAVTPYKRSNLGRMPPLRAAGKITERVSVPEKKWVTFRDYKTNTGVGIMSRGRPPAHMKYPVKRRVKSGLN